MLYKSRYKGAKRQCEKTTVKDIPYRHIPHLLVDYWKTGASIQIIPPGVLTTNCVNKENTEILTYHLLMMDTIPFISNHVYPSLDTTIIKPEYISVLYILMNNIEWRALLHPFIIHRSSIGGHHTKDSWKTLFTVQRDRGINTCIFIKTKETGIGTYMNVSGLLTCMQKSVNNVITGEQFDSLITMKDVTYSILKSASTIKVTLHVPLKITESEEEHAQAMCANILSGNTHHRSTRL